MHKCMRWIFQNILKLQPDHEMRCKSSQSENLHPFSNAMPQSSAPCSLVIQSDSSTVKIIPKKKQPSLIPSKSHQERPIDPRDFIGKPLLYYPYFILYFSTSVLTCLISQTPSSLREHLGLGLGDCMPFCLLHSAMSPMRTGETKADVPSAVARTVGTFPARRMDQTFQCCITMYYIYRHVCF